MSIVSSGLEISVEEFELVSDLETELMYCPDSSITRLLEEPEVVVSEDAVVSGVRISLEPELGFESEKSRESSKMGSGLLEGGKAICCRGFLWVPDGPGLGSAWLEDVACLKGGTGSGNGYSWRIGSS